jgi:hypothetical protein
LFVEFVSSLLNFSLIPRFAGSSGKRLLYPSNLSQALLVDQLAENWNDFGSSAPQDTNNDEKKRKREEWQAEGGGFHAWLAKINKQVRLRWMFWNINIVVSFLLFVCLFVFLLVCLFVFLLVCLFVCLFAYLSAWMFVYLLLFQLVA